MIFSPSEGRLALSRSCLIVYYGNYYKNSFKISYTIYIWWFMSSKTKKDRPSFSSYPILFLFHSCFWNYERLIAFDGFRIIKSEILWYYQSQRSWIWKYLWKIYKKYFLFVEDEGKRLVRDWPSIVYLWCQKILITILSLDQSFLLSSSS